MSDMTGATNGVCRPPETQFPMAKGYRVSGVDEATQPGAQTQNLLFYTQNLVSPALVFTPEPKPLSPPLLPACRRGGLLGLLPATVVPVPAPARRPA
jgi:hypothetical protein